MNSVLGVSGVVIQIQAGGAHKVLIGLFITQLTPLGLVNQMTRALFEFNISLDTVFGPAYDPFLEINALKGKLFLTYKQCSSQNVKNVTIFQVPSTDNC